MDILEQIIAHKKLEVRASKASVPTAQLEQSSLFRRTCISLKQSLKQSGSGIIAEFKRRSPSKGWIHREATPGEIVPAYQEAGASGLSILTDYEFFGGSPEDILSVRTAIQLPILRKDFIIDPYQIIEARAMGADVILLIAANLTPERTRELATFAQSLGMEVLLEIHDEGELDHIHPGIDLVGVNNRNLKDFTVSIETSLRLAPMIGMEYLKISESGLSDPASVTVLRKAGFRGFLMGEHFMKSPHPGVACKDFINAL